MKINLVNQQRNSEKFQLDENNYGVLIGNGSIVDNTFKVTETAIVLNASGGNVSITTQGSGKFYYEHLSGGVWGFGVHDPGTGTVLDWWSTTYAINIKSTSNINLNASVINFGNVTPGLVSLYATYFVTASSGGVVLTNTGAGNVDITQTNASGLMKFCTSADLALQVYTNTWGLGYDLGGSGKLELISTVNDLYIEAPNLILNADTALTISTNDTDSDIILAPNRNTTTAKDIKISDTAYGLIMLARWTDDTHTAPGTKTFRVYVDDDLGTITAEEVI